MGEGTDPRRQGCWLAWVTVIFATGFRRGHGTSHHLGSSRLAVTNKQDMHGNGKERID